MRRPLTPFAPTRPLLAGSAALAVLLTAACGSSTTGSADAEPAATPSASPVPRAEEVSTAVGTPSGETTEEGRRASRIAVTHDGGVVVLDATDLTLLGEFPVEGYARLNPAGDERHLFVTEGEGFRLLDLGGYSLPHGDHDHHHATTPTLTDLRYPAKHPGHVVVHDGRTVLYGDGDGRVRSIDPEDLRDGPTALPKGRTWTERSPHHGVAVEREDGSVITTVGDEESRSGVTIRDAKGRTVASSDECPGVHGEAAAQDGVVVLGCEDGLLVVDGDTITKVDSPDDYGRIGNQAGHDESPFVLGDYKSDPDAELERPTKVSITDTRDASLRLVDLPASYSFRSLGRGPQGEALVLGTDGKLHVIDPESGEITRSTQVVDAWEEPTEWQQARPTLHVQDETAYVTDPSTKTLHMVDIASGEVIRSGVLPVVPDEVDGTRG